MARYEDLTVWQRSHELALEVHKLTASFPASELYGLVSQLRRAAYSVPTNIVEGHARRSRREFVQFLNIAKGSISETDYLLYLSRDLGYLSDQDVSQLRAKCDEIRRMIYAMMMKLEPNAVMEDTAEYAFENEVLE